MCLNHWYCLESLFRLVPSSRSMGRFLLLLPLSVQFLSSTAAFSLPSELSKSEQNSTLPSPTFLGSFKEHQHEVFSCTKIALRGVYFYLSHHRNDGTFFLKVMQKIKFWFFSSTYISLNCWFWLSNTKVPYIATVLRFHFFKFLVLTVLPSFYLKTRIMLGDQK